MSRVESSLTEKRFVRNLLLRVFVVTVWGFAFAAIPVPALAADAAPSVVIVIEGLRDEYVTRSFMPNLRSLARDGTQFKSHYAVFPNAAAVNIASIVTGSYPRTHGVISGVGWGAVIDDDSPPNSEEAKKASRCCKPIAALTLNELFSAQRKRMFVAVAGRYRLARLLRLSDPFGRLEHHAFQGSEDASGDQRNALTTAIYLDSGLALPHRELTLLCLAEPGNRPYTKGRLQAPWTKKMARTVDAHIGEILRRHKRLGLDVNYFVTSSPGPPPEKTSFWLGGLLRGAGHSTGVTASGNNFIYVPGHDRAKIRTLVEMLQRDPRVGPIYTQQARVTHPESFVRGALSFQAVYMDHERAPDIFVEPAGSRPGELSSLNGLGSVLIASGPSIKKREISKVPSANYDIAPTLLRIAGIDIPESMDGRVLEEALRGGPDPESVEVLRRRHGSEAAWDGGEYRLMMTELGVGDTNYVDSMNLSRGAR
jgi:hypothetical protein